MMNLPVSTIHFSKTIYNNIYYCCVNHGMRAYANKDFSTQYFQFHYEENQSGERIKTFFAGLGWPV